MKTTKLEKKALDFIHKHLDVLFLIIITLIALTIRILFKDYVTGDYRHYLHPWFNYIKENGGILALKDTFSNYNQPYLTILALFSYFPIKALYAIKIISAFSDIGLAISVAFLTKELLKDKTNKKIYAVLAYSITLLLPTVMMNGALWAQCDSIYTMFVIWSLYYLLQKKYHHSFIFLGISFAFKLQFIFILPVYIILYLKNKDFSIVNFLYLPLMNLLLCLPAIVVGHPILHCFTIYGEQTGYYKSLTMNMYNIYKYLPNNFDYISLIGYALLLCSLGVLTYLILKSSKKLNKNSILTLSLLSISLCVFLLPNMHERYLYMADVLSIVWFLTHRDKLIIPLGINVVSMISYFPFLFKHTMDDYNYISILYLIIIIILFKYLYQEIKSKEKD